MTRHLYLLGLLALAGCTTGPAPPPIVIGHVSDKTRLDKGGEQAEFGIRLALHDLDNEKLAADFTGRKIEVRHTDTRGQLDAFESQAVRLDSVNRCLAIFGGLSPKETAALNYAKVPILTFQGQPVAGANSLIFYLGMSPARQGAVLAKVVAADAKLTRVAIIVDDKRTESLAAAEAFQKIAEKRESGTQSTYRFSEPGDKATRVDEDAKWTELIGRVVKQEPDVIVFAGSVQDFNTWSRMVRKDFPKFQPQIVFAGSDGEYRLIDPENNVLLATAFYAGPTTPKVEAFAKAYQEKFKIDADVYAAAGYDGFRLLVDALKRTAAQLTSEKVPEELLKTKDFDGLTGPLTINAERVVQRTLFVVRWHKGAMTLVKTFPAESER